MRFVIKANEGIFELLKSLGVKNYSKLTKVPVVDKNGHTRMVYKNMNKEKKEEKNISSLIQNVLIEPSDISNILNDFHLPYDLIMNLISDFDNYSIENKSEGEIFTDLNKLDVLNHQVEKGYAADRTVAEIVYPIKNKVINEVVNNKISGIKIKTDSENDELHEYVAPSIVYFEKGNKQVSFHINKLPYQERMNIKKIQDGVGNWNNKPGDNLVTNYSKLEEYAKYKKYYNHNNSSNIDIPYIQEINIKYYNQPEELKRLRKEFDEKNKIPICKEKLEQLKKDIILDMENNVRKLM